MWLRCGGRCSDALFPAAAADTNHEGSPRIQSQIYSQRYSQRIHTPAFAIGVVWFLVVLCGAAAGSLSINQWKEDARPAPSRGSG